MHFKVWKSVRKDIWDWGVVFQLFAAVWRKKKDLPGKRVQDECHHWEPALHCCKTKDLPKQSKDLNTISGMFKRATVRVRWSQRPYNLLHSWRSDPVTDSFAPDCPLQPSTGPRSCSRCTASTQSDSQWGPGPRCSCGSYWPLWTDVTRTGPKDVNSWPWLLTAGPSSVTCVWSQYLKHRKLHHND